MATQPIQLQDQDRILNDEGVLRTGADENFLAVSRFRFDSGVEESGAEQIESGTCEVRTGTSSVLPWIVPTTKELPRASFQVLQAWVGVVTEVADAEFQAELHDQTNPERSREVASFLVEEVSNEDHELIAKGAVFYWSVGYRVSPSGQKDRVSSIRFRRLPAWSRRDIEQAEGRAEEWLRLFAPAP